MSIHITKTLKNYIDDAYSPTRLRRDGSNRARHSVLAKVLAELEAGGDAMRCLNRKGRIAWKATPQLRTYLADLQADAEADAEEEML